MSLWFVKVLKLWEEAFDYWVFNGEDLCLCHWSCRLPRVLACKEAPGQRIHRPCNSQELGSLSLISLYMYGLSLFLISSYMYCGLQRIHQRWGFWKAFHMQTKGWCCSEQIFIMRKSSNRQSEDVILCFMWPPQWCTALTVLRSVHHTPISIFK